MTNAAAAATAGVSTASASSKRSRKNSEDEHRSKSRTKKKSGKRRRLRDDSLSPSKTDDGSRHRRKRAKKSERRKKEPRNPRNDKKKKSKKRASRKRRYRSLSRSSGYSSRSCSTCRSSSSSGSSSVSRSPPSKPLPKTRNRSGRRGSDGGSERGRSRQRTRTTSYDDTGRSRYLSQSCSTRGGSRSSGPSVSRSGKTFEEIEQQNQLRSELVVEDVRAVAEVEIDEDSNRIMQAYDDYDRYDGRRSDDHQQFLEMHEKDDWTFAKDCKLVGLTSTDKQTIGNADVGKADVVLKKSDHDSGGLESLDLESQLRQKALENFTKFQRSLSGNTRYPVHQEDESEQTKCHNIAQDDLGNMRILERQCSIQREVQPSKSRVRSVVKLPDEEDTPDRALKQPYSNEGSGDVNNSDLDMPNKGQKNPVQLKRIKETSNETSLNASPMKEKQEKNIDSKSMSSITNVDNLNQPSQQQISPLPSKPKGNENKEDTGSQLQEKTFSRMHEGEVVQVSYKVYIPNKTPSLARRQLQR
ncbi:uncharacterized protein LOC141812855 [Curcuma longa]|uniref:uncharacterized protein LOC141812855 n=1 Tax=Curcuma longa TaxID=136217 RepID=UPI003D9EAB99